MKLPITFKSLTRATGIVPVVLGIAVLSLAYLCKEPLQEGVTQAGAAEQKQAESSAFQEGIALQSRTLQSRAKELKSLFTSEQERLLQALKRSEFTAAFTEKILEDENTAAAHSIYLRDTENSVVDLAFAGDICLTQDGYVIDHYDEMGGDINLCLSKEIMDRINEADISMINHEYPVSIRGTALHGKYYTFRAAPEREIILQQMGIDLVSLANNHIYDFGSDAFYDTLEALKQAEIPYVGAGADMEEASRPVYFVTGGIKIGFV